MSQFFFITAVKFADLQLDTTPMTAPDAEKECVKRKGHLVSIHSQEQNKQVKETMKSSARIWIGLKRHPERKRGWVWWDETEVDFGEWSPEVTAEDQNCVSMKANGSWEALTNSTKLPFVCEVINDCPLKEFVNSEGKVAVESTVSD